MVEAALLLTAACWEVRSVPRVVCSVAVAVAAVVKIVVAWVACAVVRLRSVVRRVTRSAIMVAGSGGVPFALGPNRWAIKLIVAAANMVTTAVVLTAFICFISYRIE